MSDADNPYAAETSNVSDSVNPLSSPNLYQHSGKVPATSLVIAAVVLIPLAILLGVIYSAAVVWIPFIKLRGCVTVVYGLGLGGIAGALAYQLKFRNHIIVFLMALSFVSLSYYTSWAVHPAFVYSLDFGFDADFFATFVIGFMPQVIVSWMMQIYADGLWAMNANGNAIAGFGAVAIWLIEAGVIFGGALVTSGAAYGNRPFCEICDRWTDETQELAILPVSKKDPAWQQVRAGDLDGLKKLQIQSDDASSYVELRLAECPTCDSNDFLSAIGITLTMNNGNVQKNESPVFRHMTITDAQREEILGFAQALASAVADLGDEPDDDDDVKPTVTSEPDPDA